MENLLYLCFTKDGAELKRGSNRHLSLSRDGGKTCAGLLPLPCHDSDPSHLTGTSDWQSGEIESDGVSQAEYHREQQVGSFSDKSHYFRIKLLYFVTQLHLSRIQSRTDYHKRMVKMTADDDDDDDSDDDDGENDEEQKLVVFMRKLCIPQSPSETPSPWPLKPLRGISLPPEDLPPTQRSPSHLKISLLPKDLPPKDLPPTQTPHSNYKLNSGGPPVLENVHHCDVLLGKKQEPAFSLSLTLTFPASISGT